MKKIGLETIGRIAALTVAGLTLVVIVGAFIRARRQARTPEPVRAASPLRANVVSVVEGYQTVRTENGREVLRLLAARDIAYSDGHHELEKVDLTAYGATIAGEGPKKTRILADRGSYLPGKSLVTFEGGVTVTSGDGLVVRTELLRYEQESRVASTPVAVEFSQGDLRGGSLGAELAAGSRQLTLQREARLVSSPEAGRLPVEVRGQRATYDEPRGVIRFEGEATVLQGDRQGRAEVITGQLNLATKRMARVEMRGGVEMKSSSEVHTAAEVDLIFDDEERLTRSVSRGEARATTTGEGPRRAIEARTIEIGYRLDGRRSLPRDVVTDRRTVIRFEPAPADLRGGASGDKAAERVLEADSVEALFHDDGRSFSRATAKGSAVLTVTPPAEAAGRERKRLTAAQFIFSFAPTGNLIRNFEADGSPLIEFEPLSPPVRPSAGGNEARKGPRRRSIAGRRLTASFAEATQDLAEAVMDGAVKYVEEDRRATAGRAVYAAAARTVALRGRPQLWDSTSRADAEEIDANLDSGESLLRGRVRSTWFSREATGGAAPFRQGKAPVTVASDSAIVRHREGIARYNGNVRAWQDDDFIRAEQLEIDRPESVLVATGQARSAYYRLEREVAKGAREVVPVFAEADRIRYNDASRRTLYDGAVRIRQGTDLLEANTAEATMDEEHRLVEITASGGVVMTQPARTARGERVVYLVRSDLATITGNPAVVEDREHVAITRSEKVELRMVEGAVQAAAGSDTGKRVRTTHRLRQDRSPNP